MSSSNASFNGSQAGVRPSIGQVWNRMPVIGSALDDQPFIGQAWSHLTALELAPTISRARARNAIIQDQINSPARVWQQVGALLQGALAREYTGTE